MKKNLIYLWPLPLLIFFAILQLYCPDITVQNENDLDHEVIIHAVLRPSESGYFPNGFDYYISTLSLSQRLIKNAIEADGNKLCINSISIHSVKRIVFLGQSDVHLTTEFNNYEHCLMLADLAESSLYGIGLDTSDKATPIFYYENSNFAFFFPFDIHFIEWKSTVSLSIYKDDDVLYSVTPIPLHSITSSRSDAWLFIHKNGVEAVTTIIRPPLIMGTIPAIIVILIFASLIIPSLDSIGTATEISISLLVALFTINQILIPESHSLPLFVNYFLIGEIFVILLALFSVFNKSKKLGNEIKIGNSQDSPTNYVGFPRSNVYHIRTCTYLPLTQDKELIDLSDIDRKKRRPCKKCISI